MPHFALIDGSGAVVNVVVYDAAEPLVPPDGMELVDVGDAPVAIGWTHGADGFVPSATTVDPATPKGPHYVSLSTIRDRVTAAGKWTAFAGALDSLPSDKRWHLLTLTEGVSPDDPDATALLTAVGCDPAVILAA